MQNIQHMLAKIVKKEFGTEADIILTRPDEQFGDITTSIALQLSKKVGQNPRAVAERITAQLKTQLGNTVQEVAIAGPGFINITLTAAELVAQAKQAAHIKPDTFNDKVVVTEYSDPNPFKVLHAGHLYTSIVGDVISRLIRTTGATVHRTNFGGDVGLHVARAMWGMLQGDAQKAWAHVQSLAQKPLQDRSRWMADSYVVGTAAYETNEQAKAEIIDLNTKIYQLHQTNERDTDFAKIYWTCRDWSYEYFDSLYSDLGIHPFDKYYPESTTAPLGIQTVNKQLQKGVYQKSDGAVVFIGEPHGLHTRVFINSNGLPTYEAKDVGLIMAKWRDYHFDLSLVITGNDIVEYMKVVLKSIEQFAPELASRSVHLTHGMVKLQGGVKMSSRKGNYLLATDVLQAARDAAANVAPKTAGQTALAAVKYALLKQRLGGDIVYNPAESVSLEGNSGPYIQYAHARARSILAKAGESGEMASPTELEPAERSLARKISEYPGVVKKATVEFMPHHICTYLYELAQAFNRFYEHSRVIGDERQNIRLQLVSYYADVLKDGLNLLNITAPDKL